jgi:hypothetical protein
MTGMCRFDFKTFGAQSFPTATKRYFRPMEIDLRAVYFGSFCGHRCARRLYVGNMELGLNGLPFRHQANQALPSKMCKMALPLQMYDFTNLSSILLLRGA